MDKTSNKFAFEPMVNLNDSLHEIEKNIVIWMNDHLEKQDAFEDGLTEKISVLKTRLFQNAGMVAEKAGYVKKCFKTT